MTQDSHVLNSSIKANAVVFNTCVSLYFYVEHTKTNFKTRNILTTKIVSYKLLHNMNIDPTWIAAILLAFETLIVHWQDL
jgi:hypothetical protein